jgi:predicted HNH restriction endonuclease
MDEGLQRTVKAIASWEDLKQLEANAKARGSFDKELEAALRNRSTELAIPYIEQKTGLKLSSLTAAERKIVSAVGEYVGIQREQKKNAQRTLEQLKNRKLLGAAEIAVTRSKPTRGYETLVEANLEDLSYEQIVVDHPEEFSARAQWFSRKTLGLPNRWPEAPADVNGKTQQHTERLLSWLREQANVGEGLIAPFTNAEAAEALEFDDPARSGRATGNIQSRIDFACFDLGLPPLGLTATEPYKAAWQDEGRPWAFPVAGMAKAAREREWSAEDFERIAKATRALPAQAKTAWATTVASDEARLRAWAASFGSTEFGAYRTIPTAKKVQNDDWIRDELILALDLYLRHRHSPPGKTSAEILELSALLVKLGEILDARRNERYRNPNGVYMKIMNFRRVDPEYLAEGKVGLNRGSKQEEVVWNEFASQPEELRQVAAAIRASIESQQVPQGAWTEEEDEQSSMEGRVLTRLHRARERDPRLAKLKKAKVLKETGKLACEACGFDAAQKYGLLGAGVIDAHHVKPLHTLSEPTGTKLEDLALLCATCHRVVHGGRPWLTLAQLCDAIKTQGLRDSST